MSELTIQQLTEQLELLTRRVALLERQLGERRMPVREPELTFTPSADPVESEARPEITPEAAPVRDLETSVGLRWVNRVGAVTLILGVAFFFRYAVENNWIGETARVLFGVVAGLLLLAGGEWAHRRGQRVFGQGVTGAGAATLYLSCFAAFGAYRLIPFAVAFASMAGATALTAALAVRYASQAIAVLALFGGLVAPLLVQEPAVSPWLVPIYIAILDAAFLRLAGSRAWRIAEGLALLGTALFTVGFAAPQLAWLLPVYYVLFATRPAPWLFVAAHVAFLGRATMMWDQGTAYPLRLLAMSAGGLAILHWRKWYRLSAFLITAAAASWFLAAALDTRSLTISLVTIAALFLAFFGSTVYRLVTAPHPLASAEVAAIPLNAAWFFAASYIRLKGWGDSWAALLALTLSGLHLALAARLRNLPMPNPAGPVSAGVAIALFTLAIPIQFHAFTVTMAWALEGAALIWIAANAELPSGRMFGSIILTCAVIRYAVSDAVIYETASPLAHPAFLNPRFATSAVLATALFLSAIWSRRTAIPTWAPGVTGHAVLLSGLWLEVTDWAARNFLDDSGPASASLSILFALYAVLLVALGTRQRSAGSRYMGLALMGLVVVKLYLYDIWQLDLVYRFIAFAALGGLLLAVSFLYSRYRDSVAAWLATSPSRAKSDAASEAHPPPPPE